ncbi:MAG: hypothetical protein A2Y17_05230 [Clostridiales bacterium GWF2_38_85]|nr:MAG: hypothetical protein A2Y17_05230 [Clostridiales bacterium GWF2_38_85]HBL83368.1 hypothetical protein [Clostridiales bacterium]
MRNFKKFILAISLVLIISITASAQWTAVISGPSLTPQEKKYSSTHTLTATSAATGNLTTMRFSSMGQLSSNLASDSTRVLWVELWEDDLFNSDDRVKNYRGEFSGRYFVNIYVTVTWIPGEIEDGDKTVELYCSFLLIKNPDDGTFSSGSFFNYQFDVE